MSIEPYDKKLESKNNSRHILLMSVMGFMLLGGICLVVSEYIKFGNTHDLTSPSDFFSNILREIGVLFVTITSVLLVYEFLMRKHLLAETKHELKNAIDEAGIQQDILSIIEKTMPSSYMNLIDSGVSDAFLNLTPVQLKNRIEKNKHCIKIFKIWMPFVNAQIGKKAIIPSILAGNRYKIILCDYQLKEALERRARLVTDGNLTAESYEHNIKDNINFFNSIWLELKNMNNGLENNIEFRLHDDFIGAALIGFDDYFLLGLYLNGKLATEGMQFKIEKKTPEGTTFYKELEDHFEIQWDNAYKEVKFSENGSECVYRNTKRNRDEGRI